jgi:hypothetical protein
MPLTKMQIQPGVFKDDTVYSQEGKWVDSEKVRFLKGRPEKIGGWAKLDSDNIASGAVRTLLPFRGQVANNKRYIGIGTHSHLYLYDDGSGSYIDVTPGSSYTAGNQHTTVSSGVYSFAGIWTLDTLGEDLIGVNSIGGKLYKLDLSAYQGDAATNAAVVSNAPSAVNGVVVHQDSGITVCYGAHDGSANAPMRVAWTDLNDITDWTATLDNFAGAQELHGGNLLLAGIRTKGQILIFSDTTAFSMTFVGQPDVFQFQVLAENAGIVGPQACVEHNGVVYWMGNDGFYAYNGQVQNIPCSVERHVFDNLTKQQKLKCFAALNAKFNEVWFFYPVGANDAADDITNYVIFNYLENLWSVGTLARGAWAPEGIYDNPLAAGTSATAVAASTSYIYKHESGTDDESSAMTCSVTSGDIDLPQDGDDLMFINDFIPDFKDQAGNVTVTVKFRDHPNGTQRTEETITAATSTTHASMRARGRQISMVVSSAATSSHWRLGDVRFNMQPDGKRNT